MPSFPYRQRAGSVNTENSQDVSVTNGRMRDGSPQPMTTSRVGPEGSSDRVSGVTCGGRERI